MWAEYEFRRMQGESGERDDFGDLRRFGHRLFITKTDSEWNSHTLYIAPMPWYR